MVSFCACAPGAESVKGTVVFKEVAAPQFPDEGRFELDQEEAAESSFLQSVNTFGFEAFSKIAGKSQENAFCSPLSLHMALSMAAMGAEGNTQKEVFDTLRLDGKTKEYLGKQSKALFEQLYCKNKMSTLTLANSLWIDSQYTAKEDYAKSMAENFYAALFSADFSDASTSKRMGEWIAKNTGGVLKPQIKIGPQDMLALINTVFLKDEWINLFDKEKTAKDAFHRADGSDVQCDFMHIDFASHGAIRGDGYVSSYLNMKNAGSMWFVLPDEDTGAKALLADPRVLAAAFDESKTENVKVNFSIPKFSFGNSYDLIPALKSMGMKTAFESADFSGISPDIAFISQVRQDAHIAIDEKGVEAAAFTEMMMAAGAAMPGDETVEMKLDRPFIFGITSRDGTLVFAGTVYDPSAK
jgi:serpin B